MSVIITAVVVVSSTLLGLFSTDVVKVAAASAVAREGGEEGGDGGDGDDRFSRRVVVGSSLVSFFVN